MTLRQLVYKTFWNCEEEWMFSKYCPELNKNDRFYVCEDENEVRSWNGDRGIGYSVKASSKFKDGFLADVQACKIGPFYVALFDESKVSHKRWRLKMHQHGWEQIPTKYYDMEVEEP